MGVYMGIFNFFIVIPQLVAASALGFVLRVWLGGQPIYALAIGGLSLLIAGVCVVRVPVASEGSDAQCDVCSVDDVRGRGNGGACSQDYYGTLEPFAAGRCTSW